MFRLFAIVALVAAFGGALYFSGDALEAWESPKPAAKAAPAPVKKSKSKKHRKAAARKRGRRHGSRPQPTWLAQLNALCLRSQEEAGSVPPPITAEGAGYYVRQLVPVARRFNRKAETLLYRGPDRQAAGQMERLFASEESLLTSIAAEIDRRRFDRANQLLRSLGSVGRSENRILTRLGARDCTYSQDAFGLG